MKTSRTPISASVTLSSLDILETRFHDASVTTVNGSGGVWVALGGGSALTHTIKRITVDNTTSEPLEFGTGATAGAAVRKFVVNRGEGPFQADCSLASGAFLWVRSLSTLSMTTEYIVVNLLG